MVDEDLPTLEAIQVGREDALVALMQRYREPVFRLAYRYTGNAADAAELTEETFAKVYFKAGSFRPRGSVRSWVYAIAANLARDCLRRQKRHRGLRSIFAPADPAPTGGTPTELAQRLRAPESDAASSAEAAERLEEIDAAIRDLPEKLRFPFLFCVLEEHSQDEAAEVLGTTRKTVELRIYRARKELQARLGR